MLPQTDILELNKNWGNCFRHVRSSFQTVALHLSTIELEALYIVKSCFVPEKKRGLSEVLICIFGCEDTSLLKGGGDVAKAAAWWRLLARARHCWPHPVSGCGRGCFRALLADGVWPPVR